MTLGAWSQYHRRFHRIVTVCGAVHRAVQLQYWASSRAVQSASAVAALAGGAVTARPAKAVTTIAVFLNVGVDMGPGC